MSSKMFVRRMISFHRLMAFIAFSVFIYCLLLIFKGSDLNKETYLMSYETQDESASCYLPHLQPFAPEMIKHLKKMDRLHCGNQQNWVDLKEGEVSIQQEILSSYPDVYCDMNYIIRKDDDHNQLKSAGRLDSTRHVVKLEHDFFELQCVIPSTSLKWKKIFAGLRKDPLILKQKLHSNEITSNKFDAFKQKKNKQKLNVMFFGIDSLSRVHFIRKMPRTYDLLTNRFNAHVLQMYNIVGDGSPQALIPILTGQTELELPLTLKNKPGAQYVDVYPFIWKNFSDHGYLTQYGEDTPHIGTFTYRMRGFKDQPTDFYMRPFYLRGWSNWFTKKNYCYANRPRHNILMDWAKLFFTTYPNEPKYAFNFHAEISHDDFNLVQVMDDDAAEWLLDLENLGVFNNSLVIFMSDHGARFSAVRNSLQGKFEERLPFFSIMVPDWFKKQFPNAYSHLIINSKSRFMTPFDIHATVMTVLTHFNEGKDVQVNKNFEKRLPRSLSVFENIPAWRSCEHSDVENHWCSCLQWLDLKNNDSMVIKAASAFADYLNSLTQDFRNVCEPLQIDKITRAQRVQPKADLLHFKKSADTRGFVPDLSDHTKILNEMFQIQVIVKPSGGMFEATVNHVLATDMYHIKESEISRINMYGNQDHCIHNTQPQLRKYCFCKNN